MVIQLVMSFDHLSLPTANNNNSPNLSISQIINNSSSPNSLKRHSSDSHNTQYKYSKNKHLSQQIHKRKKNRQKQTQHKKRKIIKLKQQKCKHSKSNKISKQKRPKNPSLNHRHTDDTDFTYIHKLNEINKKHKKIQIINKSSPYYYFQTTSLSNKDLHNFNYNKQTQTLNWVPSPQMSPLLLPTNKGEVLLGFESENANVLFKQLSEMKLMSAQDLKCEKSKVSVISDKSQYRNEGLDNTIQYSIDNCLNTLKAINNANDSYTTHQLSVNKLCEMECIIAQLKDKISGSNEEKVSVKSEEYCDGYYEDNDSNQSMIAGVTFIEDPTPKGANTDVVYYD